LIDKIDRIIISELQKDGRIPLNEIAKKVGISHVAIRKRLIKLLKSKMISTSIGINAQAVSGSKIAVITAEVENYPRLQELIRLFQSCPRVIFLSALSASNLMAIVFGENMSTLESTIGVCSIRVQKGVRRSDVQIGDVPAYPKFIPITITSNRDEKVAPCGAVCTKCERFKEKMCFGCPATQFYNGPL
jgi:Lrp/AsnC family transcriptional regulator for asnA, asnC and gidA